MSAPIELDAVEDAIAAIAAGEFVVVVDDEDRENEGDLIIAADAVTAEQMAFLVRHSSGVVCCAITGERADELRLPQMVEANADAMGTAFTVTVDAVAGTTTGISAADRTATCHVLADPDSTATDLARPGHVFPLRAREGGVATRPGHTEAAVDLARLAGRAPAGILCEIVDDDGSMARLPRLHRFARDHGLRLVSIADLVAHLRRTGADRVERTSSARIPTHHGEFRAHVMRDLVSGVEHVAYVVGDVAAAPEPLVRVHSECLTGDVLGSVRCDCGSQLDRALAAIADEGVGALLYLRDHEGRGIGLSNKLRAYELQDAGLDTVEANVALGFAPDLRSYDTAAAILSQLGVSRLRLLTNNPAKTSGLCAAGIAVAADIPLAGAVTDHNTTYLTTKHERMGHAPAASAGLPATPARETEYA
ncbi:MAG: bifunctional 3,4-dihydroxy-2-butanone-4-phosphate synthase/GTP cyclohydrolase II [Actinomycetota bacterium]